MNNCVVEDFVPSPALSNHIPYTYSLYIVPFHLNHNIQLNETKNKFKEIAISNFAEKGQLIFGDRYIFEGMLTFLLTRLLTKSCDRGVDVACPCETDNIPNAVRVAARHLKI